ncbi:hypothetical protein DAETH_40390 (plasmid) [Deinococcus aetherius]|uniref:Uncharacterized protein n=1 Tax=Deinococcus aetherius TaxID=200252 RepID=A0ABM8AJR6_9DEIO|nr:hypothetical protein [Deinococcus aetherius]BDP44070.1 hypothetical protein DAETH_40390 [Deinococcus aetherius]
MPGIAPPPQAAHRKLHDDPHFATITVGAGWQVRVGDRVLWRWQDPAEEVWEVTELLREAQPGSVVGLKVVARRAG